VNESPSITSYHTSINILSTLFLFLIVQLKAELEDSMTKKTNDDDGDDDDFDDLADFDDLDDLGESIVGCDCVFFVLTNVIVQMMTTMMMTTLNWRHRLRENWLMRSNLRIHNSSFLHVTSLSRRDVLYLCSVTSLKLSLLF
jgi:hypothetical protein